MNPTNPNSQPKRILMIAYYYPPLTDVGCKRSVAFAKYFKKYGWEPYVLSVKNPDKAFCSLGDDMTPTGIYTEYTYSLINIYKLLGKINGLFSRFMGLFKIKIKRNYFNDLFSFPDLFWGWIPLTTIKGIKLIKKHNIDLIYVSCKPFSSALIGVLLKFFTKKPLILDFRDAYSLEAKKLIWISSRPRFRKKLDKIFETIFLKYADIFIIVTEKLKELYLRQYPFVIDKIFTIHNGVDSEIIPDSKLNSKYSKFTIVYGGLYFYEPYERNSEFFFEALSILKKGGLITNRSFQFLFFGNQHDSIRQVAKKYHVEGLVTANSRVPFTDILTIILKSHLHLIRNREFAIPVKLFEAISLNIPLLATIPLGEAQDIITKYSPSSYIITEQPAEKETEAIIRRYSPSSLIVSDPSADNISGAILDAMDKYRKGEICDNYVRDFLKRYSRENLTLKLLGILKDQLNIS